MADIFIKKNVLTQDKLKELQKIRDSAEEGFKEEVFSGNIDLYAEAMMKIRKMHKQHIPEVT